MTSANQTPRIITITTPGPQGPQGPPGVASSGSNTYLGDQIITGSILISGSIIPDVGVGELTSSFSLGSETAAWKDIFVSNGSIKFIQSGAQSVTLSAVNGGIQVNSGSIISANGVSGQFITSKSLNSNIAVQNSNNGLLMGPIDVETDKEIVIEEGSDLTIFGDIEITSVATADTASFSTSASFSDTASFSNTSSFSTSASFADTASFSDTASYAVTASYILNSSCSCTPFPYSGSAVITGSLSVTNGSYEVINTNNNQVTLSDEVGVRSIDVTSRLLNDSLILPSVDWDNRYLNDSNSTPAISIDWENRKAFDTSGNIESIDWASRLLTDSSGSNSLDWGNRNLININGSTAIDYSSSSSLLLTAGGSTFDVAKHTTFTANGAGSLTITSPITTISGSILLTNPSGLYNFVAASSNITGSSPTLSDTAVAFAQSGANFFIYVYIGGRWRSASLS